MLQFAIEQANDGIAIMEFTNDPQVPVRIVYANAAVERLSGYFRDELLDPSNPFLKVQPQNRSLYEKLFEDVRAGRPVRFEIELVGKDRATWAEIRWSPLRYDGGIVTHYVAVLRDASERRRANIQRELLHRAIEESVDYVVIYDATPLADGGPRISYANAAFCAAMGYPPEEIIGLSYSDVLAPDNDPLVREHIAAMIESLQPMEKEVRVRRRDGSSFWLEFTAYPIEAEGMQGHWFVTSRDITPRRQTLRDMAIVTRAIDAMPIPVEVYAAEQGGYVSVFRNRLSERSPEAAREERLNAALAVAVGPAQSDTVVIPLCDEAGIADAIVMFSKNG